MQFFKNTACRSASPHRNQGKPAAQSIACTFSIIVWFSHSEMPFCSGVSWTVSFLIVPLLLRCVISSINIYSPPQSECRHAIPTLRCFSTHALNVLYALRMSFVWSRYMVVHWLCVRATLSNIPKRALCRLYKNSGSDEMRLMG